MTTSSDRNESLDQNGYLDRNELIRLIDALCAETISREEHARLERLLTSSGEARRTYQAYIAMHLGLYRATRPAAGETDATPACFDCGDLRDIAIDSPVHYLGYVAVAVTTLALSLFAQFWLHTSQPVANTSQHNAAPPATPQYVATLGSASECLWGDEETTLPEGWRLTTGDLALRRGVAEIRFDSGVTMILEGPLELTIESADAATLLQGQVVLRGDAVSDGFALHTPDATLVDIGTEYAVAVDGKGRSEVHVFDGCVERHVASAAGTKRIEQLTAGQARRFDAYQAIPVPLDVSRFVRHVASASDREADPARSLLIADPFDYDAAALPTAGSGDAGRGWKTPWHGSRAWPGLRIGPLRTGEDRAAKAPWDAAVWQDGPGEIGRRVATPLRLDVDTVYYVSFVFQRSPTDEKRYLQFRLHTNGHWDAKRMLRMGIAHPNLAFLDLGKQSVRTHLPLDDDRPYLLVAKIVAGRTRPDQAFLSVYSLDRAIGAEEPANWTLSTDPVHCDMRLDDLWFLFRGEGTQAVDELRIGRTWRSVTAPHRSEQRTNR